MSDDLIFDEADRILIATVDTAIEVGVGRTFTTNAGQEVRVEAITDNWIGLAVMRAGWPREELRLPRKMREIALATAQAQAAEEGRRL